MATHKYKYLVSFEKIMEEATRFCSKCKDARILIKPDYLPLNSNAFRCSMCNSKIFVSKKEIAHHNSLIKDLNPNSLLNIIKAKQAEYLRNKVEGKKLKLKNKDRKNGKL